MSPTVTTHTICAAMNGPRNSDFLRTVPAEVFCVVYDNRGRAGFRGIHALFQR